MFIDTHKDENSTLCLDIGICHSSENCLLSSNLLPKSPVNYEVDSFILAVQWPPGVCSGVFRSNFTCRIDPVPANFTIHGLWPQLPIENLDPNQIDGLTEELNKKWSDLQRVQDCESVNVELNLNWPDLKRVQDHVTVNFKFLNQEWKKHGNYSSLGMHAYFKKTLDLFNRDVLGLKAKLEVNGIEPSNSTIYNLTDIEVVINITHGFNATITCVQRNDNSNNSSWQIQEIRFNYTKNFEKANNSSPSNCKHEIREGE
nr:hypothetical protein [Tanacetum cinerariifolium]